MVKPFDFDELVARLRALMRRAGTDQGIVASWGAGAIVRRTAPGAPEHDAGRTTDPCRACDSSVTRVPASRLEPPRRLDRLP
jgi:DNA-binding response OmpR family regulator